MSERISFKTLPETASNFHGIEYIQSYGEKNLQIKLPDNLLHQFNIENVQWFCDPQNPLLLFGQRDNQLEYNQNEAVGIISAGTIQSPNAYERRKFICISSLLKDNQQNTHIVMTKYVKTHDYALNALYVSVPEQVENNIQSYWAPPYAGFFTENMYLQASENGNQHIDFIRAYKLHSERPIGLNGGLVENSEYHFSYGERYSHIYTHNKRWQIAVPSYIESVIM